MTDFRPAIPRAQFKLGTLASPWPLLASGEAILALHRIIDDSFAGGGAHRAFVGRLETSFRVSQPHTVGGADILSQS